MTPDSSTSPGPVAIRSALPTRPIPLGDVLDGAFRLFRADPRTVLVVTAAIVVPVHALVGLATRGAFLSDTNFSGLGDPTVSAAGANTAAEVTAASLSVAASLMVTPLVAAALAPVVNAAYRGVAVSPAQALRSLLPRLPALAGSFVLIHLAEVVAGIFCLLPALGVMAAFVLTAPVIAVERLGAVAAMRRSWALVQPRFWAVLGASFLAGFVAWLIEQSFSAVPAFLIVFLGGDWGWVIAAALTIAINLLTEPLVALVAVLLHVDARMRREGLDIHLALDELSARR